MVRQTVEKHQIWVQITNTRQVDRRGMHQDIYRPPALDFNMTASLRIKHSYWTTDNLPTSCEAVKIGCKNTTQGL